MSISRRALVIAASLAFALGGVPAATASDATANGDDRAKPTVVLVHGAFADSSSWNGVVAKLRHDGYPVTSAANPLRDLNTDAAYVNAVLKSVPGPIVLVGHSYGGSVITNAVQGNPNVKALVYVAAFAPDQGESANDIQAKFPGSTLGAALEQIPLADGTVDLSVRQDLFPRQFAADAPLRDAQLAAVAQRPVNAVVFGEPSGEPAWRSIRSYFLIPTGDVNIPPAAQEFMAGRAHGTVVIAQGASHAVLLSQPGITTRLIEQAAKETR